MDDKTLRAILSELSIEDLNEDLRTVATMNANGLDAVRCFLASWDGERICLPTVRLMNPLMQRYARRMFGEGHSIKDIARRCGRPRRLISEWVESSRESCK